MHRGKSMEVKSAQLQNEIRTTSFPLIPRLHRLPPYPVSGLVVQPNLQLPSHELRPVQCIDGVGGVPRVAISDRAIPPLATVGALCDLGAIDVAVLAEVILELAPTGLPREVPDEELTSVRDGDAGGGESGTLLLLLRVSAARITAAIGVSVASGILVMVSTAAAAALLAILAYVDGTAVQLRILELAYRASDLVRFLIQHDAASLGSAVGRFDDVGLI